MEPDSELTESQNQALAIRVREELARRRMSRQQLADAAKISISTLEKALNGSRPFTMASVVRLETALGLVLRSIRPAASLHPELGGYARAGVAWLEGDYLTLRPSFELAQTIFAYRTHIGWNDELGCLAFQESDRLDTPFSQKGLVSISNKSGHIYLHTNEDGQMRLGVLGRPLITGELYGLLTTLISGAGGNLTPVSTPFALLPWPKTAPALGRIGPSDNMHAVYKMHLDKITAAGHARLLT